MTIRGAKLPYAKTNEVAAAEVDEMFLNDNILEAINYLATCAVYCPGTCLTLLIRLRAKEIDLHCIKSEVQKALKCRHNNMSI